MLLSELADRAEVPVATVKYYVRSGLLAPGHATGPRRADYDETHLRRLRILRMLREIGGIPVSTLQQIVDAIDDPDRPSHEVLCLVSDALTETETSQDLPSDAASRELVDQALNRVGWSGVRGDAVDRAQLAALVRLLSTEGPLGIDADILSFYVEVADQLCRAESRFVDPDQDRATTLEELVAGEAVFGQVLTLLRRMGHEHYHAVGTPAPPAVVADRGGQAEPLSTVAETVSAF
jgi:DNA-binding transcriptional MerR regulator